VGAFAPSFLYRITRLHLTKHQKRSVLGARKPKSRKEQKSRKSRRAENSRKDTFLDTFPENTEKTHFSSLLQEESLRKSDAQSTRKEQKTVEISQKTAEYSQE